MSETTVKDLVKLEDEVMRILQNDVESRSDDQHLYTQYVIGKLEVVYPQKTRLGLYDLYGAVMNSRPYRARHGIAEFGSVARCRRKLQEKYDSLKPSEDAVEARKELAKQYRKYARGEKE